MPTKYTITCNKYDAALSLLETTTETYTSRAAAHLAATARVTEHMKDCESSPRLLSLYNALDHFIRSFRSNPQYDVIKAHYTDTGKFTIAIDYGEMFEYILARVAEPVDEEEGAAWPAPPPVPILPQGICTTYAQIEERPWVEVPIVREERDEGRIVPALDVSPRAIKEFRVSLFRALHRCTLLVIDERGYNGMRVRHMINCSGITEVKTLREKKVVIRAGRNFEFAFTDDACAFAFQAEVEVQLNY